MRYSLYCYFKIDASQTDPLPRLRALQAELAAGGAQGRLLRRKDDAATWMEAYEDIADWQAFRREWLAARARHGLDALPCHEEWFQPLTPDEA
ncbi:DUF4936 domain-containing protein [Xenophilus sp. AP218F]|nr:DUF4936 family protein [Chromobacterium sp. ASV5]OWY38716.1 DUF4936 domain-containing protein [Xenophilus sp. AP218F]